MRKLSYGFLYGAWIALGVVTAALSFWTGESGVWLQRLAAAVYFVPAGLIVLKARQAGEYAHTRRVRRLAALWLVLAVVLLCLNIASVRFSQTAGDVLYAALAVVCAPLACGGFYALPLFGWAVLLFSAKSKPMSVLNQ